MNNLDNIDDGFLLIYEPGYKRDDLLSCIEGSCLEKKCAFLQSTKSLKEIFKGFVALLEDDLSLEEVSTLILAGCIYFGMNANEQNLERRYNLLERTFVHVDTLNPVHLNVITKNLWLSLNRDDVQYVFNILNLCPYLAIINETSKAIAIGMMWAILSEITETEYTIYFFRKISDMTPMLKEIDEQMLQVAESTQVVYILVDVIIFLMNAMVFENIDREVYIKLGFGNYFSYTIEDLKEIQDWCEGLSETLNVSTTQPKNFWYLRMMIKEKLHINLLTPLQEKIYKMM